MFERLRDVPLDVYAYREVLVGSDRRAPEEWRGFPVVDLTALPQAVELATDSPEYLAVFGINTLLGPGRRELTASTRGLTAVDGGFQAYAYFLALGTYGSDESGGIGATIRAVKTADGALAGLFGSVLQLLPLDAGQRPADERGQLRTRVVAGFRLLMPASLSNLSPLAADMWDALEPFWPIGR